MINHLRTLLLNLPAPGYGETGEDYIPPSYVPRVLNNNQVTVHRALFGQLFPRRYRAFVATHLSRVVDNSPFRGDIDRLDRRRLISPPKPSDVEPLVKVHDAVNSSAFHTVGSISGNPTSGIFSNSWKIERETESSIRILDENLQSSRVEAVTFNGSNDLIRLEPGSGLFVHFVGVSAVPEQFRATVFSSAPMFYDLFDCLDRLRASRVRSLFGLVGDTALEERIRAHFDGQGRVDWAISAALTAYVFSFEK